MSSFKKLTNEYVYYKLMNREKPKRETIEVKIYGNRIAKVRL
jgi:hypothetical protein